MSRLALAFFALAVLAGCDSADDPVVASLLPDEARYVWSVEQRIVETDSVTYRDADAVHVQVADRNASVPGYRGLTEVEITMRATPDSAKSRTWYETGPDRLREVAYRNAGAAVPAEPRGLVRRGDLFGQPYIVAEQLQRLGLGRKTPAAFDSLIVRDDPRVVYELPLEIGEAWVSFTDPFRSTRSVVGREAVTVAAGTFDCFVVRTEIGISGDRFEWLDYVSPEHGLVLRTLETVDEIRGPDNQPLGLARFAERLERTE